MNNQGTVNRMFPHILWQIPIFLHIGSGHVIPESELIGNIENKATNMPPLRGLNRSFPWIRYNQYNLCGIGKRRCQHLKIPPDEITEYFLRIHYIPRYPRIDSEDNYDIMFYKKIKEFFVVSFW